MSETKTAICPSDPIIDKNCQFLPVFFHPKIEKSTEQILLLSVLTISKNCKV